MARYEKSEETLRAKILWANEKEKYDQERLDLRKRRELMRRQVAAQLYEPRICMGDPVTGQSCHRYSIPGAGFCADHGGTTKHMQAAARTRLLYLVEPALRVMNKAMASGDLNIAIKAAQIILDRAGFHPHATLEIAEQPVDYGAMSTTQLAQRAHKLLSAIESSSPPPPPEESEVVLDIVDKNEPESKVH